MKHFKTIVACCCICSLADANQQTVENNNKKTILIFFNALYRPQEKEIEKHVRNSLSLFRAIGLLFTGIPEKDEVKRNLFDLLGQIPLASISVNPNMWKSEYGPWDIDYRYPPILNQLITSSTLQDEQKIYAQVRHHIQHHAQMGTTYKIILQCIADFMFQSKRMNNILHPVRFLVDILRELQRQGHKLILVVSSPGHAWDTFINTSQAQVIKELFPESCRYVSGKENLLPTSPRLFEKIIAEHNLTPHRCIIIAHNVHDFAYPKKIGMCPLVYNIKNNNMQQFKKNILALIA